MNLELLISPRRLLDLEPVKGCPPERTSTRRRDEAVLIVPVGLISWDAVVFGEDHVLKRVPLM